MNTTATTRPELSYQGKLTLVTHAEHTLGKHVAARLLCSGRVRAHVTARHPSRTQHLHRAGAEIVESNLYAPDELMSDSVWRGVGGVVHASASGASQGKEAVVSVSDLGTERLIQAAGQARVQGFVVLYPPTPEIRSRLERSTLPYTLLCPKTQDLNVTLSGGAHGQLLERRRLVVFMPLLRVVDVLVFAASGGFERMTLSLPTVTRRYSNIVDEVERLVRLAETPVADPLLAELIMGSPYKLVTPGVARALGLGFPKGYLGRVFSPPED